jgi:Raf kinase inhibitor-like YbhB/YbcL family protein
MKLESQAFQAESLIPKKYTCDGDDISPPLSWGTPPDGTQSLALIADDPDAPGQTFVHWVAYNLPSDRRELPEGVPNGESLPNGGIQGKSDFGKLGYGGPCPPGGTHRYFFKLYALDTSLDLQPGASKADVERAIDGHVLTLAELMGRYSRDS